MKIAVVGTGYVGLVAGTCFAESGNTVICVDVDAKKVAMLNDGKIPIYEPGLEELVHKNVEEQRLSFTTDIDAAVKSSLIVFIAVGTPPDEDGSADLKHVLAAARSIGKAMNGYKIIVDKSTVPVGTAQKVAAAIAENTSHPFNVVSNPEFLKEGAAIDDFMKPDRVVIGTDDPRVAEIMKELYAPFVRSGNPIIIMDIASAELTKYAANAMLATRISFMNEIAQICDRVGANVTKIREGIGYDSRIGMPFLYAGCGYGGSCFPKDTRAIQVMQDLYAPFLRTGKPVLVMDPVSAEMTKYAANAMLATRISFMNEMARICEVVGADVNHVRKGIGTDERIGFPFLFAGVGYGGSCFPKDVRALVKAAEQHGYSPKVVHAVEQVNDEQKKVLAQKVRKHFGGELRGRHFAVWGLAFKPKTDDMREAPSLVVIDELLAAGATVTAFDPEAMKEARRILGDKVRYSDSAMGALRGADALILVTEWNEFRQPDFELLKRTMKQPVLLDGRNVWDPAKVRALGFTYQGIGRSARE